MEGTQKKLAEYKKYNKMGMEIEAQTKWNEVDKLITSGHFDFAVWDDIRLTTDMKRKVTDSQYKREVELEKMITTDKLLVVIMGIVRIFNNLVDDEKVRMKFADQVETMVIDYNPKKTKRQKKNIKKKQKAEIAAVVETDG